MVDVRSLINSQPVRALFEEFAAAHDPRESADEFLNRFGAMTVFSAKVAHSLGNALGVRNTTYEEFVVPHTPLIACLAAIGAVYCNGLDVEAIEETADGGGYLITADVPSTWLHFAGQIVVSVAPDGAGSTMEVTIVVPGQVFVWGAGKRLIKAFGSTMADAAIRLGELPSVADVVSVRA